MRLARMVSTQGVGHGGGDEMHAVRATGGRKAAEAARARLQRGKRGPRERETREEEAVDTSHRQIQGRGTEGDRSRRRRGGADGWIGRAGGCGISRSRSNRNCAREAADHETSRSIAQPRASKGGQLSPVGLTSYLLSRQGVSHHHSDDVAGLALDGASLQAVRSLRVFR
jgi:hypothetical protein